MADEIAATDSASVAETATASSGSAGEQVDATHGGAASEATETSTTEGTETPDESGDLDDNAFEEQIRDLPDEEKKTKSQERRERRQARDQKRIDDAVTERLAVREREQATAAEQAKQQEAAQKAAKARTDRLSAFIGVPDAPDKPGTLSTLQSEINDLNRQIRSELAEPAGADLDAMVAQVAEKEARVGRLNENLAMSSEIEAFVWDAFGGDFASAAEFPEFTDAAMKAAYLNAAGGVRGALGALRDVIKTAAAAEHETAIKALEAKHATAIKALEADVSLYRLRAGGVEGADTTSGGQPALSGQLLTPERYHAMTFEQRQKLKSTPEGRAQIDAMTQRSGAA